jgi:hypothetical protein
MLNGTWIPDYYFGNDKTKSGFPVPEKTGQARGNDKIETGFTD